MKEGDPKYRLGQVTRLVDLLNLLQELRREPVQRSLKWGVTANVSLDLLGYALEKHGFLHDAHSEVSFGDLNDHAGNLRRFAEQGVAYVLLIQCFDQLLPSLESRPQEWESFFEHWEQEFGLLLQQAGDGMTLFVLEFHSLLGGNPGVDLLNTHLRRLSEGRVVLLKTAEIVAQLGEERAFSLRYYFQHRAPFTLEFWDRLAAGLFSRRPDLSGRYRKVLVLDADNTLWGGTVGEDGLEGLRLDPHAYPGNVFWTVQKQLLELHGRGVLLALSSKNNREDALEVLAHHPHCLLKAEHFISLRIDWTDKVTHLEDLARELNLGLDSLVFLDDSPLECEQVRQCLPEVETCQVPSALYLYPSMLARLSASFPGASSDKTAQYVHRRLVEGQRKEHASQSAFLQSLQMNLRIRRNPLDQRPRLVELSQKTNQFNLTTLRYSPADVENLIHSPDRDIFSLDLSDRFGGHGVVGLLSWRRIEEGWEVENFLLSCRVLGRGVELAIWQVFKEVAARSQAQVLQAEYRPSAKNAQVKDFYPRLGMQTIATNRYRVELANWEWVAPDWIEVIYSDE